MSAVLPWTSSGTVLTAEQEFARYAYALREVHQAKRLQLDNFSPASTEPFITVAEGFYQHAVGSNKQHLIIVCTLPLETISAQFARKPWLNVQQLGTEPIPSAYGTI